MQLVEYFHKDYPEAHPMHLMADLVGVQQLLFGYQGGREEQKLEMEGN